MLSEDLVREIVALRRRVERLEAQEPVAGAVRNGSGEGLTIDADGTVTVRLGDAVGAQAVSIRDSADVEVARVDSDGNVQVARGVSVGTTGALQGQVKTFGHILGGASLYLNGQTTAYIEHNAFSLQDEESAPLAPAGGTAYGLFVVHCSSAFSTCLVAIDNSTRVTIIADTKNQFSTTDTDGKHCILWDGANIVLKNRFGVARNYRVHGLR